MTNSTISQVSPDKVHASSKLHKQVEKKHDVKIKKAWSVFLIMRAYLLALAFSDGLRVRVGCPVSMTAIFGGLVCPSSSSGSDPDSITTGGGGRTALRFLDSGVGFLGAGFFGAFVAVNSRALSVGGGLCMRTRR